MQKSGYVNNLVDMREQLRRNYRNPEDVPAPTVAELSPEVTPEKRFDAEAHRDARDLEGRLLSALATAQSAMNLLDFRRQELHERIEKLQTLMTEMESLGAATPAEYRAKVDQLRYKFFEIAVENNDVHPAVAAEAQKENSSRNAWIVAGAIILGALIVGAAFFISF